MVENLEPRTIFLTKTYDISFLFWEDLMTEEPKAIQFLGGKFIEQNIMFKMDCLNPFQDAPDGVGVVISLPEEFNGALELNFNTYFSEN